MDDSAYDELLQQVESLKVENKFLKKELSTNTTLINRLESEATNLKQMVIQLGKSINSSSIFDEKAEQNASLPQVLPRETACTSSNSCSNVPSSKVPIESKTVQSHRWNPAESSGKEEKKKTYFQIFSEIQKKLANILDDSQLDLSDLVLQLENNNIDQAAQILVSFSATARGAVAMRKAGCLPLLVSLVHCETAAPPSSPEEKKMVQLGTQAMQNLVLLNPDFEQKQAECQIFKHLQIIRAHCDDLCQRASNETRAPLVSSELLKSLHIIMGHSYYKPARCIINRLGGLQCIANLFVLDCDCSHYAEHTILRRQCIGLILTNLMFGDPCNKVLLIKKPGMLDAILKQLRSDSEDVQQAMACILRNLSWQADETGKECLQRVVKILAKQMSSIKNELTLKSFLGALWNLSGHSSKNQEDICSSDGALSFLVNLLAHKNPTKSVQVVENAGGILRNVSLVIAKNGSYRKIVREENCFETLLTHLESSSLTIVGNACGTLRNLSWRDATDQQRLVELGAVEKLKKLVHSKHKLIAQGSVGALANLLHPKTDVQARHLNNTGFEALSADSSSADSPAIQLHGLQEQNKHSASHFYDATKAGRQHIQSQPSTSSKSSKAEAAHSSNEQVTRGWSKSAVPSIKILSNLRKKLQHVDDDFAPEDDNPINYSLQYSELSSSPQQNLYLEDASKSFASQPGTSARVRPYHNDANRVRSTIDVSVEQKVIRADNEDYESEDTPTNFGAIYTEEHLDEECLESTDIPKESNDCVKTYHVEDTPICFSTRSSMTDLHASGSKAAEQKQDESEAEDKFDTGAYTPAHYFKSNRHSGFMTPRTPLCQDTPLMCYSPAESRSSLDSCDQASIHSDVSSQPESRLQSGYISPSELPDSPGQSMPQSRCRSPFNQANSKDKVSKNVDPGLSELKGMDLIKKAHAMSAGYLATLPQKDEIKHYEAEPAMSVMTRLSGLTIFDEKIQPMQPGDVANTNNNNLNEDGNKALMHAGYVTSLPTSDEIKHYYVEGSFSPFTGLSEISALNSHNEGFQRGHSKARASNSCTSRSSATGASVPLPPVSQESKPGPTSADVSSKETNAELTSKVKDEKSEDVSRQCNAGYSPSMPSCDEVKAYRLETDSPVATLSEISALKLDNDGFQKATDGSATSAVSDFLDSSSDDDGLLEKVIESAIPKNRSNSKSSKSNGARKDKTSKLKQVQKAGSKKANNQPSDKKSASGHQPGLKIDTRDRIAAADERLNGMDIVEYIESKMASSDNEATSDRRAEKKSQRVKESAESLGQSYSVIRHIAEARRDAKSSLHCKPTTFNTEGTPIEISRCTSLSDLTIDSEPKNFEFSALKGRLTQDATAQVSEQDGNPAASNDRSVTELASVKQADEVMKEDVLEGSSISFSLGSDDGAKLLNDCITSAMPIARKPDAIPPKQLVVAQANENVEEQAHWVEVSTSNHQGASFHINKEESDSSASSVKLGGDARSFMKSRSESRKRMVMGRDESSGSRRNETSGSSPCNKCKASSSVDRRTSRRRRKSSSHTRYTSIVEQRKPVRSRSAHTGLYAPGVTQIYPRFKEIDPIVFSGLATMAARGEKVQYECRSCTHSCHGSRMIKQAAYVEQQPSHFLLHSNHAHSHQLSKATKNLPKKKKISLKTRFKKLISSGAESKKRTPKSEDAVSTSSSLTLSSSSSGSHSSASVSACGRQQSGKSIYPTVSSITPNHIPKSPSAKSRLMIVGQKHSRALGASGSSSSLTSSTAAARRKTSKWNN